MWEGGFGGGGHGRWVLEIKSLGFWEVDGIWRMSLIEEVDIL